MVMLFCIVRSADEEILFSSNFNQSGSDMNRFIARTVHEQSSFARESGRYQDGVFDLPINEIFDEHYIIVWKQTHENSCMALVCHDDNLVAAYSLLDILPSVFASAFRSYLQKRPLQSDDRNIERAVSRS